MVKFYWSICSTGTRKKRHLSHLVCFWQTDKLISCNVCVILFHVPALSIFLHLLLSNKATQTFNHIKKKKKNRSCKKRTCLFLKKISLVAYYCLDIWLHVMDLLSTVLFWSLGWKHSLFQMQKRLSYSRIYHPFLSC